MKAGTIIQLPDGRVGTVVYNSLDGVGIKWGRHTITMDDIQGHGGLFENDEASDDYQYYPEAMLRNQYPSATLECVGEQFKIAKP